MCNTYTEKNTHLARQELETEDERCIARMKAEVARIDTEERARVRKSAALLFGSRHWSCDEGMVWRESLGPLANQATAWALCRRFDWLIWQFCLPNQIRSFFYIERLQEAFFRLAHNNVRAFRRHRKLLIGEPLLSETLDLMDTVLEHLRTRSTVLSEDLVRVYSIYSTKVAFIRTKKIRQWFNHALGDDVGNKTCSSVRNAASMAMFYIESLHMFHCAKRIEYERTGILSVANPPLLRADVDICSTLFHNRAYVCSSGHIDFWRIVPDFFCVPSRASKRACDIVREYIPQWPGALV